MTKIRRSAETIVTMPINRFKLVTDGRLYIATDGILAWPYRVSMCNDRVADTSIEWRSAVVRSFDLVHCNSATTGNKQLDKLTDATHFY